MPGNGEGLGDLMAGVGDSIGHSLQNRLSAGSRARLVAIGGGTPASEAAVDKALKWLAEHQNTDGSWSFDHRASPKCKGRCKDPGNLAQSKIAATAMALLPFLGTGETHHQGKYKRTIEQGLYFLVRSTHVEGDRASLLEPGGRMYGHGLASIALCEAYGMTHDKWLQDPAQRAVNFIVWAQDPNPATGGWRYYPQQAGDTSVVGWQVMALRGPHGVSEGAARGDRQSRLLSRFGPDLQRFVLRLHRTGQRTGHFGHRPVVPDVHGLGAGESALQQGVAGLVQLGPSLDKSGPPRNNLYYDYYATQVMHHYGGSDWQRWNVAMRDYLVKTQFDQGHTRGSWHFEGSDHGFAPGGRLYCTALATMILEVYYRHMPLYTDLSTKDKFRN